MLRVTYRLAVDAGRAAARAEEVAREQTVEVPRAALRDRFVLEEVVGRVESRRSDAAGSTLATIAYPVATTAFEPAQLVNVIFGNSSLHADIECVDVDVPASLRRALRGPRFGIEGLRKLVGVWDRPLTCTAVKPMGLSPKALAELAYTFACAGIDVIKDDHGLAAQSFCPFEERVPRCLEAVERAARETGRRALYVPNLIGTPEVLAQNLRFRAGTRRARRDGRTDADRASGVLGAVSGAGRRARARASGLRRRAADRSRGALRSAVAAVRGRRGDLRELRQPLRRLARAVSEACREPARAPGSPCCPRSRFRPEGSRRRTPPRWSPSTAATACCWWAGASRLGRAASRNAAVSSSATVERAARELPDVYELSGRSDLDRDGIARA